MYKGAEGENSVVLRGKRMGPQGSFWSKEGLKQEQGPVTPLTLGVHWMCHLGLLS